MKNETSDMRRGRGVSRPDQFADGKANIIWRVETLFVQINDMEFDGDELQPIFIRDDYTDGFSAELDNLLLHGRLPHWLLQQLWRMKFSGTIEPKALHSTARKGAAIRANHFKHNLAAGGDENRFEHVTLPSGVVRQISQSKLIPNDDRIDAKAPMAPIRSTEVRIARIFF